MGGGRGQGPGVDGEELRRKLRLSSRREGSEEKDSACCLCISQDETAVPVVWTEIKPAERPMTEMRF